jgi:hypothetical protein
LWNWGVAATTAVVVASSVNIHWIRLHLILKSLRRAKAERQLDVCGLHLNVAHPARLNLDTANNSLCKLQCAILILVPDLLNLLLVQLQITKHYWERSHIALLKATLYVLAERFLECCSNGAFHGGC